MTLRDVCIDIWDCPHTTANDEGEGYPLIRTPNIGKGRFILDGVHRVCEDVYNLRNKRAIPQDDDLIFAREAPAGNVAIIKNGQKLCLGQRTVLIRPDKEKVNPDFLTYFLLAPIQQHALLKTANGSTASHVNMKAIRGLKIDLPPRNYQDRAASIIADYDNLIELNNKRIAILEEMAMRTYREWFVFFRFPGHETTEFVDDLPKGWTIGLLGHLGKFKRGKNITIAEAIEGEYPVVAGGLNPSCYHNDFNAEAPVITVSASGANAGFTRLYLTNIWAADCSFLDSKCMNTFYIYCFLKTYKVITENLQIGSAQPHVYAKDLNTIRCIIPASHIISVFTDVVKPIFEEIKNIELINSQLQQMRDRLLPQLMSGQLEVTP